MAEIKELLKSIYEQEYQDTIFSELQKIMDERKAGFPTTTDHSGFPLSEKDAYMITYGDQFQGQDGPPLEYLQKFSEKYLKGIVSGIHILPFFPYTSDDGFSVVDYRQVHPDWGDWNHIQALGERFGLMSDLVLNHCSASSVYFKEYLEKDNGFFIDADPEEDWSYIVRPRALPLLTPYETAHGKKHIWTTFSADQVDLNFANPKVLLEMLDVLLFHVQMGIKIIRLDAIAYLWKEKGHPSIHHPKTHQVVQLFRAVIEKICPWVVILTETNVPHKENISYFGNGRDEAHMIYQFSLPPLILDAFLRSDPEYLRSWASSLPEKMEFASYFNFCASHDGIGVTPTHGILTDAQREQLVQSVLDRGGRVSYKNTADGKIPYELNINYCDAVAEKNLTAKLRARKFLASQSIMLAFPGIPGIYVHSFLGSGNWSEGIEETRMNRTINRQKFDFDQLNKELENPDSFRNKVYSGYSHLLSLRQEQKAFHPLAAFSVIENSGPVFSFFRSSLDGSEVILCLTNISDRIQNPKIDVGDFAPEKELLLGKTFIHQGSELEIQLDAWETVWIRGC
jgi:glycosidase